jgi:L-arabinose transport system substrate-binding protein
MVGDKRRRTAAFGVSCAVTIAVVSACGSSGSSGGSSASGTASDGGQKAVKIAYIQKQGDQQYFVDEANGAKAEARKLGGANVQVVNVNLDSNAAINAMNAAIAQGVNGIAIVAPDQKIGPQVIDLAKQAKIPLIASDDPLKSGAGQDAPFVGFDSLQMGQKVGAEAGKLYKAAGWAPADTALLSVYKQDLSDCQLRDQGEEQAFQQAGGTGVKVIKLGTDNSNPDAQNRTGAIVTAHPNVKHWVVVGCNDESETGAVTALANAGFKANDVIGVGLGAYLTCKDWKAGKPTGNKAALYISGQGVGTDAARVLIQAARDKKPLPAKTVAPTTIVDASTWQKAGVQCT